MNTYITIIDSGGTGKKKPLSFALVSTFFLFALKKAEANIYFYNMLFKTSYEFNCHIALIVTSKYFHKGKCEKLENESTVSSLCFSYG